MTHRRAVASTLVAGALTLVASACGTEPAAPRPAGTETRSHALNGTIIWGPWSGPDTDFCRANETGLKAAITGAWNNVVVPGIVTSPADVTECLKDAILSGEEITASGTRYDTTYPEFIMERLRDNLPTRIDCKDFYRNDDGSINTSKNCGYGDHPLTPESFDCRAPVFQQTFAQSGGEMTHEVAHRFYTHPMPAFVFDYNATVNQQVRNCLTTRYQNGVAQPFFSRRTSFTSESSMSPVGNGRTTPSPQAACTQNQFFRGFWGRSGAKVDRLGGVCAPENGTTNDLAAAGGTGGSPFRTECAADQFVVGLQGRASANIDAVGPICANAAQVRAGNLSSPVFLPLSGGSGGTPFIRWCPQFMAIKASRLMAGGLVDRIEFVCQDTRDPRRVHHSEQSTIGFYPSDNNNIEHCANRGVMTRMYSQADANGVIRLGSSCDRVDFAGGSLAGQVAFSPSPQQALLPSHGGVGGTAAVDDCAAGEAMVGLTAYSDGGNLVGVSASCVNLQNWSGGTASTVTSKPVRGKTTGTFTFQTCPIFQVMTGWHIGSTNRVHGIAPVCRSFWP